MGCPVRPVVELDELAVLMGILLLGATNELFMLLGIELDDVLLGFGCDCEFGLHIVPMAINSSEFRPEKDTKY